MKTYNLALTARELRMLTKALGAFASDNCSSTKDEVPYMKLKTKIETVTTTETESEE